MYAYMCWTPLEPPTTEKKNTKKQDKAWIKGNIISHFRRMYDAYFQDVKLLGRDEVRLYFLGGCACIYVCVSLSLHMYVYGRTPTPPTNPTNEQRVGTN
jgi:hypothetical protein